MSLRARVIEDHGPRLDVTRTGVASLGDAQSCVILRPTTSYWLPMTHFTKSLQISSIGFLLAFGGALAAGCTVSNTGTENPPPPPPSPTVDGGSDAPVPTSGCDF